MNKSVMIVDDDDSVRLTVGTVLSVLGGFEVTAVEGGKKCLEELERGFQGVILMDVMMPEMDGWETIREMRNRGLMEGNILSVLTAIDIPDSDIGGLARYIWNYIRKPFEAGELLSAVNESCLRLQ